MMAFEKKSKRTATLAVLLGSVLATQSAYADYTRSCEMQMTLMAQELPGITGSVTAIERFGGRTILAEVTAAGAVNGSNTAIRRRQSAKAISTTVGQKCIEDWHKKAIKKLNAGETTGKISPSQSLCKTPEIMTSMPHWGDMRDLSTTAASVDSIRWAYEDWYRFLSQVCHSRKIFRDYNDGIILRFYSSNITPDGECGSGYDGSSHTFSRILKCDGNRPSRID